MPVRLVVLVDDTYRGHCSLEGTIVDSFSIDNTLLKLFFDVLDGLLSGRKLLDREVAGFLLRFDSLVDDLRILGLQGNVGAITILVRPPILIGKLVILALVNAPLHGLLTRGRVAPLCLVVNLQQTIVHFSGTVESF